MEISPALAGGSVARGRVGVDATPHPGGPPLSSPAAMVDTLRDPCLSPSLTEGFLWPGGAWSVLIQSSPKPNQGAMGVRG